MLISDRFVECRVLFPGPGDMGKVPSYTLGIGDAYGLRQRFDRHLIQTLARGASTFT